MQDRSGPMRTVYDYLSTRLLRPLNPGRQHPLKHDLATVTVNGTTMPQWQYEVTGASRIWYAVNEPKRTTWITHAATGHPSKTDK